jgi:hypothetical protein
MNTKKDEPAKPETAAAAGPASNRPHATLDLKATVVEPKAGAAKEPSKDAAKEPAKDEKKPAGTAAKPEVPTPRPTPGTTAPQGAKPAPGGAPAAKSGAPAGPAKTAAADVAGSEPAAAAPVRSPGRGGFFTHLAAGIVGGIVALLAADIFASQLGLGPSTDQADATAVLQQRVAELETSSKNNAEAAQLAARLKTAESKLQKLEQLRTSVDKLAQAQGALARDM